MSEHTSSATSRRGFVSSVAGLGAACAISDWSALRSALAYASQATAQQPNPPLAVFTADEAAVISAAAARIIPSDDTPGAREAGVVYFIDRAFNTFLKDDLAAARKDLRDLNARAKKKNRTAASFTQLPPAEQDAVLKEIENTPLFGGLRYLTIVGMFADPSWGGNRDHVGWKLLGFEPHAINTPPFGYYDAQAARGER